MAIRSLNRLAKLRTVIAGVRRAWLVRRHGVVVHPTASLSLSSRLLTGKRGGIVIGEETLVAFKTLIFTTCPRTGRELPVRIGRRCFIGGGSMLLPGVVIGDESIVAAGAVVVEDVPPRSIVGGNPARIIRSGIEVGRFGRLAGADQASRRLWK